MNMHETMRRARGRTTPGTTAGSWAPTHRNEADLDLDPVQELHECSGADLPRLAFTHKDRFDPSRVATPRNDNFYKPAGGLWLSPYADDGRSHWEIYIDRSRYDALRGSVPQDVAVAADARVLVIDTREDFLRTIEEYSYEYLNDYGQHSDVDYRLLDFEAIARDFDAVWVTQRGVNTNQLPSRRGQPVLGPWDIPSVLVLNAEVVEADTTVGGCTDLVPAHTSVS